jgi:hypothetical protein
MDTETVTVLRPGGRDDFGDPLPGTEHAIAGCLFAPRGSSESSDFANTVITGAQLFAPAGADIRATDQVRIRGVVYDVEGDVGDWGAAGVQVALQRGTG